MQGGPWRGSRPPWVLQGPVPSWALVSVWAAASCLLRSGAFYKTKGNKKREGKKKKKEKLLKKATSISKSNNSRFLPRHTGGWEVQGWLPMLCLCPRD